MTHIHTTPDNVRWRDTGHHLNHCFDTMEDMENECVCDGAEILPRLPERNKADPHGWPTSPAPQFLAMAIHADSENGKNVPLRRGDTLAILNRQGWWRIGVRGGDLPDGEYTLGHLLRARFGGTNNAEAYLISRADPTEDA